MFDRIIQFFTVRQLYTTELSMADICEHVNQLLKDEGSYEEPLYTGHVDSDFVQLKEIDEKGPKIPPIVELRKVNDMTSITIIELSVRPTLAALLKLLSLLLFIPFFMLLHLLTDGLSHPDISGFMPIVGILSLVAYVLMLKDSYNRVRKLLEDRLMLQEVIETGAVVSEV